MEISIYKSNSLNKLQNAARYACERYLELGIPVILVGSAYAHSGISTPSQVILDSKISRGYSFNLLGSDTIDKIGLTFSKLNSTTIAILAELNKTEALQLDLIFKIAALQQREILKIENLLSTAAWLINNYFELPSWYGQLNLESLCAIQNKLLKLFGYKKYFNAGSFSLKDLGTKDYLGYGICNLIDSDSLSMKKLNFITACLLQTLKQNNNKSKAALVIEDLQNRNLINLIERQDVFSNISISCDKNIETARNLNIIDADTTVLTCRSKTIEKNTNNLNQKIEVSTLPKISAMFWDKSNSLTRKSL